MRARRLRQRLTIFLAVLGPGIITASVDQDAGGITTYTLAGARYGYRLLWSLPLIGLALAVVQEMGTRMGVVSGKGLAELIRERFGVRRTLLVMGVLMLANLANTVSEFAGVAASLDLFGVSPFVAVPLAALLVSTLVVRGSYAIVERIFLAASVFYLVYVVSAFLAKPAWGPAVREVFHPSLALDSGYLIMLITLVGTTIAPWMQFYLQSSIVDKGLRLRDLRFARWDAFAGSGAAVGVAFFIIVCCAATLHRFGIDVETAGEAALALEPLAGRYATLLFGLGLLNASLFSAAIVPLSTAYAVCEALGWQTGVDRRPGEAPGFFAMYLGMVGVGAALVLLPGLDPIQVMFYSQFLNGLLLPAVLVFMLILINDREVMGAHVNSPWVNLVAWGTACIVIGLDLLLVVDTLRGGG
jgi:NRAMP (natural resistance-associated macrophage protein)-like metal ion transporter